MQHYINQNLNQLKEFIACCPIQQLMQKGTVISASSVGMHIRHVLEFYDCLIQQATTGEVNYDKRTRNLLLETSVDAMLEKIEMLKIQLENLVNYPLNLTLAYGSNDEATQTHATSVFRELGYCLEHSVHHFALIKCMILSENPLFEFATDFGIASSTVRNTQTTCAQ